MSVMVNDNSKNVIRDVSRLSHSALVEFTDLAKEITTEFAPVRQIRGGNHRSLIDHDTIRKHSTRLFSQSGYGAYLEFGTSRMAPRPHFSKGIKGAINQFKDERKWKT